VTKFIEDYTDEISFLWWQLGVTSPEVATEQVAARTSSSSKKAVTKQ
jgi:hypothetical protein